jgi:hypothetical protein
MLRLYKVRYQAATHDGRNATPQALKETENNNLRHGVAQGASNGKDKKQDAGSEKQVKTTIDLTG